MWHRLGAAALFATMATSAWAQAIGDAAVFPLDSAPASALRLCGPGCVADDEVSVTVSGAGEPVSVTHFTPRVVSPLAGAPGLGAIVSAFGVDIGGALTHRDTSDRVSLGAAYDLGDVTLGGEYSFDVESGAARREGAASLGLDYLLQPGVTVGGGLRLKEPGASVGADVSAGFQMRLDF